MTLASKFILIVAILLTGGIVAERFFNSQDYSYFTHPSSPPKVSDTPPFQSVESQPSLLQELNLNRLPDADRFHIPSIQPVIPPSPTSKKENQRPLVPQVTIQDKNFSLPNVDRLQKFLSPTTVVESQVLPLPTVEDRELTIDAQGVKTLYDFLFRFATDSSKSFVFPQERLNGIVRSQYNTPLFFVELIDKGLSDNNLAEIHDSLNIYKDFLATKMNFEKSIKVSGEAIQANKVLIGFDILSLQLIEKVFALENKVLPREDFMVFYQKYNATTQAYNDAFLHQEVSLTQSKTRTLLSRFLELFGFNQKVYAQGPAFGGFIVAIGECTCTGGLVIVITAPTPGGLYYPYPFLASPLLFLNKSPFPGHWILGNYFPIGVCFTAALCVPGIPPTLGTILIAGTS